MKKKTNDEQALYDFLFRKNVKSISDAKLFRLWWKQDAKKIIMKDE